MNTKNEDGVQDDLNLENELELDTEDTQDESIEDLKEKLQSELAARQKAEEIAKNQKIRAEKAENKAKSSKPTEEAPVEPQEKNTGELNQMDMIAIIKNNVNEDDIQDVVDYAQLKGVSVNEALKLDVVKTILRDKDEKRATAQASHTGSARRSSKKISDETLLANARKGEMPESDEDIQRLIQARKESQRTRRNRR